MFVRAGHILSVTFSLEGSPRRLLESLHDLDGDVQEAVPLQLVQLRRHPFADAERPFMSAGRLPQSTRTSGFAPGTAVIGKTPVGEEFSQGKPDSIRIQ